MEEITIEKLRYPIGKFQAPEAIDEQLVQDWINQLEALPAQMQELVTPLTEEQLNTPYRPDGWTVRQVVHHVSDSHHHSYTRFKWALTEDRPVIKPYFEKEWANLFDTKTAPIQMSLDHLKAVHTKLVHLLRGLSREDLKRTFIHPEDNSETTLEENIGRYVWHGSHHYNHIKNLLERKGW